MEARFTDGMRSLWSAALVVGVVSCGGRQDPGTAGFDRYSGGQIREAAAAYWAERDVVPEDAASWPGPKWLIQPETILEVQHATTTAPPADRRELMRLYGYLLVESLKEAATPIDAELNRCQQQPVQLAADEIEPYLRVAGWLPTVPDPAVRRRVIHVAMPIANRLADLISLRRDRVRARARALGFSGAADLVATAQGWDLRTDARLARQVLIESEALYRSAVREIKPASLATTGGAGASSSAHPSIPYPATGVVPDPAPPPLACDVTTGSASPGPVDPTVDSTLVFLSELITHEPEWLSERLEEPALTEALRRMALAELIDLRRTAALVLIALAWHEGASHEPDRIYAEQMSRALPPHFHEEETAVDSSPASDQAPPDTGPTGVDALITGSDFSPFFPAVPRLRALLLAPVVRRHLREAHGAVWWRAPAAVERYQELCHRAPTLSGTDIAATAGVSGITTEPALRRLAQTLVRRPQ